jgi:hypothetical protein
MARWSSVWSSLKDALVIAVRNWRLWLLHFVGNAAIFLLCIVWVRFPDAHWWQLFLQLILIIVIVVAVLVLHGGTLNYFQNVHQDATARLAPAFRAALKHVATLAVWTLVVHVLWHLIGHLDAYSTSFPGYLRSGFPVGLRRMISESALDHTYSFLVSVLRWVVLPGLSLPFALFAADRGFRGLIAFRDWWRTLRNLAYWIALSVAAIMSVYCVGKVMGWTLDPQTATLSAEKTSLVFRLLLAYLLGIFSWFLVCSALGRTRSSVGQTGAQPT